MNAAKTGSTGPGPKEQLNRQSRLYAAIAECAQAFAETRDLYEIIKRAVSIIREQIGFDRVGIFLYDDRRERWRGMFGTDADGRPRDEREIVVTRNPRLPIVRAAAGEGDEFFVKNFCETFPEDETMRGVHNNFFIALRAHGRLLGGISVDNLLTDRLIDEESREALRRFARYVALALENLRLFQALEEKNKALEQELTQREKVEKELQDTLTRLYGANRDLEDFAAVLSHDIKTPLRGMVSLAEWVREDYADRLDPEGREKLDLMIRRGERLRQLIDGILHYSRGGRSLREMAKIDAESGGRKGGESLAPPAHGRVSIDEDALSVLQSPPSIKKGGLMKKPTQKQTSFTLTEADFPTHWYNLLPDLPEPLPPPLHPGTREPIKPEELAAIFPENLIAQEVSPESWIEIPEELRSIYASWRPTPLLRARRLEKALDTPAHIYYKYEGVSPVGSHKLNTAIAQAYYNREAGIKRLATETGAGQWGSALSLACQLFGLECVVYMVKVSYEQKPYRKSLMQTWGATVHPSPSNHTEFGRKMLEEDPNCPGSLGIAISEAIEDTVKSQNTKYSLGSVLNHVCLHQTVIGQEVIRQMEMAGEEPDVLIGCVGGGSNFAGISFPFIRKNLKDGKKTRIVAVEPTACPTLTKGELRYDFGDTAEMTPLLLMYTLGHRFIPPSIHAGGLRYHGMAPAVSHVLKLGLIDAVAYPQNKIFEAAVQFARTEGIVPAPEPAHALRAGIDEALRAREAGENRVILLNMCGHGMLDLSAYDKYLAGELPDNV